MILAKSEYDQEYATIADQCMSPKTNDYGKEWVRQGICHNNRLVYDTKRQMIMTKSENAQKYATITD